MAVRDKFSARVRVTLKCGPGRTKQSFRDECDINRLMRRYEKSGTLPQDVRNGRYGDFSGVDDYLAAQVTLRDAEAQFAAMPARVRDRFKNSPLEFLAFVGNPKNKDEARTLGLLREEPVTVTELDVKPKVEEPEKK